jgi:hypothetical protein
MEFYSKELMAATEVESSITYVKPISVDVKSLKDDIRIFILAKDKYLLNAFEEASLKKSTTIYGNDTLKNILTILKDNLCSKYKHDNVKHLTLRKNFDIIFTVLDTLTINGISCTSDELNAIILGYLSNNFI